MRNDPEVRQVIDQFQLGFPNSPVSGRSGDLLGRGTGSSLEFQEHRDYLPGDDIRHLDWAAFARTDSLMIRMYREEISPRTRIFLDGSRSMKTGDGQKSLVSRQLASSFSLMISALGGRPAVLVLGDQVPCQPLLGEELDSLSEISFDHAGNFADQLFRNQIPFKPKSARILISDFLFPHDPSALIKRFAADASLLWVIQVLSRFEGDPQPIGGRRLTDIESSEFADLRINQVSIDRYQKRLGMLQLQLREQVQRVGGKFRTVIADQGLHGICAGDLCRSGILRPR